MDGQGAGDGQGAAAARLDEALRAVADVTRREILRLVASEERSAGDIAANFTMSRPAVSQHLRVLHEAGLVSVRAEGTRRWYSARPETMAEVRAALDTMWADRLDRLSLAAAQADWPERTRAEARSRANARGRPQPRDRAVAGSDDDHDAGDD